MSRRPMYATEAERRAARRAYNRAWKQARRTAAGDPEANPLRRWRKGVGLTQREAGALLGVSATAVCDYEGGTTPLPEWLLTWLAGEARTMTREEVTKKLEGRKRNADHNA